MPNLVTLRPADGNEVVAAWKFAVSATDRPTALILTRQNLPVIAGTEALAPENLERGAYVLSKGYREDLDGILIATGSEVKLAIDAQAILAEQGFSVTVVSMPSLELFDVQDTTYQESVLPNDVRKRVSIEMGATFGWERFVGLDGAMIGIDKYGASAPGDIVIEKYGFTVENVVQTFKNL